MSGVGVNVSSLGSSGEIKIRLNLDATVKKLVGADVLAQDLETAMDFGVRRAQSKVPYDTGELHDSIGSEVNGTTGTLYASAEHALPVEFGHRTRGGTFVSARPYLRPAADETFDYLVKIITRRLESIGLVVE
jgi:citrate lyase gamma subunit